MATQDKEDGNESPQDAQSCQSSDAEKKNKFPGFNLYVKNLDDSFTDATLREAFDEFGTITSTKVMCDATGNSRGFGFVCFTTQDEADRARTKMNGRIVGTKPLYVSMAQRKEERKQYLTDKYKNAMTSSLPVSPPLLTQQHPQPIQITDLPPSQIQYLPNNAAIPGAVQYRYLPQETQWQATGTPYIVQPTQPGFGAPVAVMSYQPLLLVPGVSMMAAVPPPPMPILQPPIYIHSTKTNTLIYSTSVQANSHHPQVTSPGVYSSVGNEVMSVPASYQEAPSPHTSPHFKPSPSSVHHVETAPASGNTADLPQKNGNMLGKVGPMQIPGNAAFQFQAHSNSNFAT